MLNSIIIPCRNWHRYLRQCLWSIERSEKVCGVSDYEIIVVDDSDEPPRPLLPQMPRRGWLLNYPQQSKAFNKSRLQNWGIEQAKGDIFTFLDADTIVGPRWLECAARLERLGPMALTKLCYRVRMLPKEYLEKLEATTDRACLVDGWFAKYDTYDVSFEAYDDPGNGQAKPSPVVFGKSDFSITRQTLGDLRFNEEYEGRGFEDLWMNRAIAEKYGWDRKDPLASCEYKAGIVTDADHALFQIRNRKEDGGPDWGPGSYNKANFARYQAG